MALMRIWCSDSSSDIVMVKLIIPALHAAYTAYIGSCPEPLDARDVHDRAASALLHQRCGGVGCREHAHEVDVDVAPPAPFALLEEQPAVHAAGVVHEDVQLPEVLGRSRDGCGQLFGVHHVDRQRERVAAELGDRGRGAFGALGIDVDHGDVGTELREPERDSLADPAAGAGHDRGLAGEQDVGRVERGVERVARDFECLSLVQNHDGTPVYRWPVNRRTLWWSRAGERQP